MHLRGISLAWAVCGVQVLISAVAALLMLGLRSGAEAGAALFGGLAAIAPNVYFALKVYSRRRHEAPREVLGKFYRAEIGKIALVVVLFFLGTRFYALQFLPLMLTYMACQTAYWVVLATVRID